LPSYNGSVGRGGSGCDGVTVNWSNAMSNGCVTVTGYLSSLGQSGSRATGASTPSGFLGIGTETTAVEFGMVRGIDVGSAHGVLQILQNVTYAQ
jgi:hypothetical protein